MAHIEDRLDALEQKVRILARAELRRTITGPAVEHAEPTYISGSSDRVYTLATMPTRYLVNVQNMSDDRVVRGLRAAIRAELAKRRSEGRA
jgi:hypothetical protein